MRFPASAALVLMAICCLLSACRPEGTGMPSVSPSVETSSVFTGVTGEFQPSESVRGLAITYDNGASVGRNSILESLGGGVGVVDFDRDQRPDFCFPGGGRFDGNTSVGHPSRLIRNVDGQRFYDVSGSARIDSPRHFSHGCSVADYDNDGWPDLLITGYGGLTLWRNLGDGTFDEVTQPANLLDSLWSTSAGWGDFNGDGVLDLYIAHYVNWSFENDPACLGPSGTPDVCPPRQFEGVTDTLYFGQGDGTFADVSTSAGLVPEGKGLGVLIADVDHDGDSDIYVANDTVAKFFYRNDGEGHFKEIALACGLALDDMAVPNGSMGLTLLDYDADGWSDFFVTNYEGELFALYRNLGDGNFSYVSRRAGLNRLGTLFVSFGCVAGDFDCDGDEDLAIANGHVVHHPVNSEVLQIPLLMLNARNGMFVKGDSAGFFGESRLGRGLARCDVDRDGRLDLVFVHSNEPATLLVNRCTSPEKNMTPLTVRLVGTRSTRDAIGARAILETSSGRELRHVVGGGSYLSTSDPDLSWALNGSTNVQALHVVWPSGIESRIETAELRVSHGRRITIFEPRQATDSAIIVVDN